YKVSDRRVRTYAGIPVFGLYPDYVNTVEVSYTLVENGENPKTERVEKETYKIYASPVFVEADGTDMQKHAMFNAKVEKVEKKFADRLYLLNNILENNPRGGRATWNNPTGGALQWSGSPEVGIIDTA
ncbi:aryl-sulfate sulfotransferase, partial [Sutterella massiliensis]